MSVEWTGSFLTNYIGAFQGSKDENEHLQFGSGSPFYFTDIIETDCALLVILYKSCDKDTSIHYERLVANLQQVILNYTE